jgi:hypothetical protein
MQAASGVARLFGSKTRSLAVQTESRVEPETTTKTGRIPKSLRVGALERIMSHELAMSVKNSSSYTLRKYSVTHSWNDHNENLSGDNLGKGSQSASIQITSGYTQYDWYTVQLTFDTIGVRQTNFYCNSSYDENQVIVDVFDTYLDLNYFHDGSPKTSCKHKGYSGLFQDEIDQKDPVKIEKK